MSVYELLGIPLQIGTLLFTIALILALSPYLSGKNFGILMIPALDKKAKRILKLWGPSIVIATLVPFVPILPDMELPVSIDTANFYKDSYIGESWAPYYSEENGKERFWVGCHVRAKKDVTITNLWIGDLEFKSFYVGYKPGEQHKVDEKFLEEDSPEWLGIPFETDNWSNHIERFKKPTLIKLYDNKGKRIGQIDLRGIRSN